ncbi:MAG: FGGY family carbohydrate kinase [Firmicutes bacterium]|nr:FGGY family carbohydrate kinase [Bacillota bacterium]
MQPKWVLGIDLGTTHVKALALDNTGQVVFKENLTPRLYTSADGRYEQDPHEIMAMVQSLIKCCRSHASLLSIGLSGAMHTFIAVDEHSEPVTRVWTWMDRRASTAAQRLRTQGTAEQWYQRTGCPVHAMSPAVKWLYFGHFTGALRPVALKDWIFHELTGCWATDFSTAAASGMLALSGVWDEEILNTLRLTPNMLPAIHPWDYNVNDVVLGGTDGALAHYGLNVLLQDHSGVMTWGTSAAIRVSTDALTPQQFMSSGSFAYCLGPMRGYLIGQALSNAGNVMAWTSKVLKMPIEEVIARAVSSIESREPLPLFIPYLFGERSPFWDETRTARFENILPEHDVGHFAGAVVLSLLALIRAAYKRLETSVGPLKSLHTGSNLSPMTPWGRLVTRLFDVPVFSVPDEDASAFGAAKLAARRQGWTVLMDVPEALSQESVENALLPDGWVSRVDDMVSFLHDKNVG